MNHEEPIKTFQTEVEIYANISSLCVTCRHVALLGVK